jgi:RHS repeat-associated protein
VNFVGCCEPYDAGAIRIDNSSGSAVTVDDVSVDIGPYHWDLWGSGLTTPAGGSLILTQNSGENFDTSDTPNQNCTPTGYVPQVHVTVGGVAQTYQDTGLILNTGGIDPVYCGFVNESEQWSVIGGTAVGLTPSELTAGGNPCTCVPTEARGNPVNPATGEFWHRWDDLSIPGRGMALDFNRTYSSAMASQNGPLGFGWTHSYKMFLSTDSSTGNITVHQENGSTVTFVPDGSGGYTAPGHDLATLAGDEKHGFTFKRDQTQASFLFKGGAGSPLLQETDRNGYVTLLKTGGGTPAQWPGSVSDPAGRKLTLSYGSNGKLSSVSDPAGRRVSFAYDSAGNLAAATDVGGGVWHFTYDSNHRMLTMTDPRGGVTTNVYDSSGRVTSQTDPMGRTTTFSYESGANGGERTTVTDPLGNVTVYNYQNLLLTSKTTGFGTPQAATTTYGYDPVTLGLTSVTDPNGHATSYTYDSTGNVLTRTDPLGQTTSYTYNSFNELATVTDPLGVTTTNTYDAKGNLTSVSTPVGTQAATTTYGYGDSAHPGDVTGTTDPNGNTTTFGYDAYGDLNSSTDPVGNMTTHTYDTLGRRVGTVSPMGHVTSYNYDSFGDLLMVTDPLGDETTYTYDADQNLLTVTDSKGDVVRNTYDADNELTETSRSDSSGHLVETTQTSYDADGNVLQQVSGLGIATATYTYDPLNRVSSMTDGLGRETSYEYDPAGNLITLSDPAGRITTSTYDAANELTGVSYSDGVTHGVSYTYDADGQRISMNDGTGTTTYAYDSLHRLAKDIQGGGQTVSYGYDLAGNLVSLKAAPGPYNVARTYDGANRLSSVTDWLGHASTFAYDGDSNLVGEAYPNGVLATLSYDSADRLVAISDAEGPSTLQQFSYGRDGIGLVTSEGTRAFGYDGANRLSSDSLASSTFAYDPADDLTQVSTSGGKTTFVYDAANEVTSSSAGARTTVYSYDSQGNRIGTAPPSGSPTTYTYDEANRLIRFSRGTTTSVYAYGGDGLRMSKAVNGKSQGFVWDIGEGLPLLIAGGSARFVTGPGGLPLEQITGSQVLYYQQDQLGSTRMLTDASGTPVATYTYSAYGALKASTGSALNPFRFGGQYLDSETGFYYLRARYYDPVTSQFVTRDPAVVTEESQYAYVEGNPLNKRDPLGLCSWNPFDSDSCEIAEPAKAITSAWNATGGQVVNNIQNFASSSHTLGVCTSVSGNLVIGGGTAEVCGVVRFQGFRPVGFATTETFGGGAGPGLGLTGLLGLQASNAPDLKSLGGKYVYVGGSGGAYLAGGGSIAGGVGTCGPFGVAFAGVGIGAGVAGQVGVNYTFEQTWLGS